MKKNLLRALSGVVCALISSGTAQADVIGDVPPFPRETSPAMMGAMLLISAAAILAGAVLASMRQANPSATLK